MRRITRQRALRCAVSSASVIAAFGVAVTQANANTYTGPAAPTPTAGAAVVPVAGEAPLVLPAGFVKQGNDYVYGNGAVRVTPAAPNASLGCSSPWLCLYRDSNWNGTRWEFQQRHWQDLAPYGANDEVSSWSNHTCNYAYLGWNSIAQGINPQFTLTESGCFGHGAYVGDTWNDQASSVLP